MKVHLISKLLFDQQLTHTHTHMIRITDSNSEEFPRLHQNHLFM